MDPVKTTGGAALTTRSRELESVSGFGFPESVTLNVRLDVPAQEAITLLLLDSTPEEVKLMQAGSVPAVRVHV
jgi:hypothetical protein